MNRTTTPGMKKHQMYNISQGCKRASASFEWETSTTGDVQAVAVIIHAVSPEFSCGGAAADVASAMLI
jgi:hypothetical protein